MPPPIILASASPRRAELLSAAGIAFVQLPADVDETPLVDEAPAAYVERLARTKAEAVARSRPDAIVLGADTVVVVDGVTLGKPRDAHDAASMLARLQGRIHQVLTGVALVRGARRASAVSVTSVWFHPMTASEIAAYVASGEPMDKAGAYAIQGLASRYIAGVEGSYPNVVGLPVDVVTSLLAEVSG